jgi:hypothetical protein
MSAKSVEIIVGAHIKTPVSDIPVTRQVVVEMPLNEGEEIISELPLHAAIRFPKNTVGITPFSTNTGETDGDEDAR